MSQTVTLEPRSPGYTLLAYIAERFGDAWFYMIGLGIIHGHAKAVPALGYWLTFLLAFILTHSASMTTPVLNQLNTKRIVK